MLVLTIIALIISLVHAAQVNVIPTCNCADSDGVSLSNLNITVNIAFDSDRRGAVIQSDDCGLTLPRDKRLKDGNSFEGEFPWYTSIYKANFKQIGYECAATLISKTAVLTSAACITDGDEVTPEQLLVFIGAYNFIEFGGHYQQRKVKQIVLHPNYDYLKLENDVGILKLSSSVQITDYVRPVCIWNGDPSRTSLIGKELIHPGWDYNSNDYINDKLTYIRMPVKPNEECTFQQSRVKHLLNSKTLFCASFHANAPTCKGDDGSGLFLNQNGVWYIRGIDSASIGEQNEVVCDDHHYAAITDIVPFTTWIRQYM